MMFASNLKYILIVLVININQLSAQVDIGFQLSYERNLILASYLNGSPVKCAVIPEGKPIPDAYGIGINFLLKEKWESGLCFGETDFRHDIDRTNTSTGLVRSFFAEFRQLGFAETYHQKLKNNFLLSPHADVYFSRLFYSELSYFRHSSTQGQDIPNANMLKFALGMDVGYPFRDVYAGLGFVLYLPEIWLGNRSNGTLFYLKRLSAGLRISIKLLGFHIKKKS